MRRLILLTLCLLLGGLALWGQPVLTPTSLPNGILGTAYSQTVTVASGGYAGGTLTYSLASGALPPGLNLTSPFACNLQCGLVAGTPTATGTFNFTMQVDSNITINNVVQPTLTGTQAYTIVIYPVLAITTGNANTGTVGANYSQTFAAVGGAGPATYTWSVANGVLPPNMSLSAAGVLSGVPMGSGLFPVTFQVASQVPTLGTLVAGAAFSIIINAAPNPTVTGNLSAGALGVAYSATLGGAGGYATGVYSFTLAGGTPPSGTNLAANGTLAGTPTATGTFNFTVQVASDLTISGESLPTLTGTRAFSVVVAAPPPPTITGSLSSGVVGSPYSSALGATGGYGAGTYTFAVTSGAQPTGLNLAANGTLAGTPTAAGTFNFTVQVTSTVVNNPALTGTQAFSVVVYPAVSITLPAANSGSVGVSYSQTYTATGGAGPATYTWSLAGGTPPPGLTMSAAGILGGTPTAAGNFSIYVQVASQIPSVGAVTAQQWFTVAISATSSPTITGTLSAGTVGAPYSAALGATGGYGIGTYTFSLASGTPPAGLTLSASGTLAGTPTAAGTSTFTVQVTNTYPNPSANFPPRTGTQTFTVVIDPVLTITTVTASSGTVGAAYSQTFTATGGAGPSTYTWSLVSGTPPPGLTLSASGVLGGTPTTAGSFTFYVQVSSQVPTIGVQTASQGFNVVIGTAASLSIAGILNGGTVGVPYSAELTGFGGYGSGTYAFSLVSGTLPAGITLSAGGVLSGTPTAAGTANFTLQVTSTVSALTASFPPLTATKAFTVVIYPPLAITTAAASSGTVGVGYSQAFTATGGAGAATYLWSLASGALPPGLTVSPAGMLTGTPTAGGTFSFTVQVSSQVPTVGTQTASQAYSVVIAAVPPFTITGNLGTAATGAPYSATFTATGGYGPGTYTFALAAGALPPGITLSSGGTLSGTPTGEGTFTLTVEVTSTLTTAVANLLPLTAAESFTLVVSAPSLTITGTLGGGTVGVPYASTLGATGGFGAGTYTFAVVSGALPADVALSAGGILSGIPTAVGTSTFTVQVTSTQTGQPLTATQSFTITVGVAPAPPVTISGLPNTPTPATQLAVVISAGSTYPIAIQGTITLTFAPASGPDDPSVQFTTGGRTVAFQIPAGSSVGLFPGTAPSVQTGTVAGTITLTMTLKAAGVDITPAPAPTQTLLVARGVPVITSATVTPTSGGFNLLVIGYSTTRDMTSAAVTFTPRSGVTLAGNSQTVSLGQVFTTWYSSATSAPFGSMFSLVIPFAIQNGANPLASLSITLMNSQGASAPAVAAF